MMGKAPCGAWGRGMLGWWLGGKVGSQEGGLRVLISEMTLSAGGAGCLKF